MGLWTAIRGWADCDDQQAEAIRAIIAEHDLYVHGWTIGPASWAQCATYAGSVRSQYVDDFVEVLRAIAAVPASDLDNDRVTGFFHADPEMGDPQDYHLAHGILTAHPTALTYIPRE